MPATIPRIPFGRTGHESSRVLFGAAALAVMSPERAEKTLELVTAYGLNHVDTAASYGESEVRLAPWLARHRREVFLATKTGERRGDAARASLERSLERMGVDSVDLVQLHNLVDEEGWRTAFAPGGAVEALSRACEEGLARFVGVTGHGIQAPAMHLRSLERHPFASVLAPYNFTMMRQPEYARDFERLAERCVDRGVALQTIKSVARRRWGATDAKRFSWYEPIVEPEAIGRAVAFVLARDGFFLNTTSDARLLPAVLDAAARPVAAPGEAAMAADVARLGIEPLFVPGGEQGVG